MQKENERSERKREIELLKNENLNEEIKGKSVVLNLNEIEETMVEINDKDSVEDSVNNNEIPKLMRIPITINDKEVLALIDCGSQASLLSLAVFIQLPKSNRNKLGAGYGERKQFKTISGELMESLGYHSIRFKLKTEPITTFKHNFYILKNLNEQVVLGLDYLTKHNLSLSPQNRQLHVISEGETKILKINSMSIKGICIDKNPVTLNVPDEHKEKIEDLIKRHPNVHASKLSEIGRVRNFEMEIKLTTDKPVCQKPRRIANAHLPQVKQRIEELLEAGLIRKSISPYSANIVVVNKGNTGQIRVCCDYKSLNNYVVKDSYYIGSMQDILTSIQGATIFSTIDIFSAYHCIPLAEKSRFLTCFSCIFGSYEWTCVPFGLATASAFFMRVMDAALAPIMYKHIVCYADDCCVFSNSIKEHLVHLELTFKLLEEAGLKIKLSKCHFFKREINYLGFRISAKGIVPSEEKLKPIRDFKAPINIKQLQRYLGMANFFKGWIKDYSEIASCLYHLTRKNVPWKWTSVEQRAFEAIKNALMSYPCVRLPILSRDFLIFVDASEKSCGGVLAQFHPPFREEGYDDIENVKESDEDEQVVISYFSKKFNDAQCRYSVTEKEMNGIMIAVKKYRQWILGRKCIIITDHKGLEFVFSKPELTSKLMQNWVYKLNEYDIVIRYQRGKLIPHADTLSRIDQINSLSMETESEHSWVKHQAEDEYCKSILEEMGGKINKKDKVKSKKFKILPSGLLCLYDGRVIVPVTKQEEVLRLNHDHKTSGHLGQSKTIEKIGRRYYWRDMAISIIKYVNDCVLCNKRKSLKHGKAPMKHIPATHEVMKVLMGDLIGPLRISNRGNQYIFNITDVATRYVFSIPLKDKTTALVAERLVNKVFSIYSSPTVFITDQGGEFNSELMLQVCALFGVSKLRSSAFHSIAQGLIEKYNRVCCDMIALFTTRTPDLWCSYLRYCTLAYNVSKHKSTRFSPFVLFYGREPNLPTDLGKPIRYRSVENQSEIISQQWSIALEIARENLLEAQINQKKYYDRGSNITEFKINEKILLTIPPGPGQKLQLRREGPYTVLRRTGESNYQIMDDKTNKLYIVHTNRMRKFRGNQEKWIIEERLNAKNEQDNNSNDTLNRTDEKDDKIPLKKPRGRPPGTKNKAPLRRGRPPGSKNKMPTMKEKYFPKSKLVTQQKIVFEKGQSLRQQGQKRRGRPPATSNQQKYQSKWRAEEGNYNTRENKNNVSVKLLEPKVSYNREEEEAQVVVPRRGVGRPRKQDRRLVEKSITYNDRQGRYNLRNNTKQVKK